LKPSRNRKKSSWRRHKSQSKELKLREVTRQGYQQIETWRKQWRLHRKLTAKSTPLEFCLRPYLALLIYALAFSLLGKGLSHLHGEPVYWALWWNEDLARPLAWLMSSSWSSYSTDPSVETTLIYCQYILMWLFLIVGFIAMYAPRRLSQSLRAHGHASSLDLKGTKVNRSPKGQAPQRLAEPPRSARFFSRVFASAVVLQFFYTLCLWISNEYRWASLCEHSLQVTLPFGCLLMLPYTPQEWEKPAEKLIQCTLTLCFIGHGLYALNISPLPAEFLNMTMNVTHLSEGGARYFLSIFGSLDLIMAVLVWIPIHELRRSALIYMMIWGLLTALARPFGLPVTTFLDRLIIWGPEALWRLSHALVPLWLWQRSYSE
jgi:hypothetical protein